MKLRGNEPYYLGFFEMVLRRIEAAIARLEAATAQPRRELVPELALDLAKLEASNARLRDGVSLTLHQIDALIARHGAEPQP